MRGTGGGGEDKGEIEEGEPEERRNGCGEDQEEVKEEGRVREKLRKGKMRRILAVREERDVVMIEERKRGAGGDRGGGKREKEGGGAGTGGGRGKGEEGEREEEG